MYDKIKEILVERVFEIELDPKLVQVIADYYQEYYTGDETTIDLGEEGAIGVHAIYDFLVSTDAIALPRRTS